MSYAFEPAGRRSESVTTFFAEELTAPEFARFVNAQTVGVLPVAARHQLNGFGELVAAFDLNRLGTLR